MSQAYFFGNGSADVDGGTYPGDNRIEFVSLSLVFQCQCFLGAFLSAPVDYYLVSATLTKLSSCKVWTSPPTYSKVSSG